MDIDALKAALAASPDNVPLLLLIAKTLEDRFELAEAESFYKRTLAVDPTNASALLAIARLLDFSGESSQAMVRLESLCASQPNYAPAWLLRARIALDEGDAKSARDFHDRAAVIDPSIADEELLKLILNAGGGTRKIAMTSQGWKEEEENESDQFEGMDAVAARELDLEFRLKTDIKFDDVGGMDKVKDDIRMKIIHPLKNPELFAAYGKKAGGGVLLYGPPGCGKTMLARATAGEINASFFSIGLHQVLDMYIGQSEQRLHQIFELARKAAPSVLFFDEIDALAADRRDMRHSAGRGLINQFLAELDGAQANNDGVLILGATNGPWHVDGAFLRPGRFDRMVFVPPPDSSARAEIAKIHGREKPLVDFDPTDLAKKTEGFSGADIRAVFDVATEQALSEAMKRGSMVPMTGKSLIQAAKDVKPSTRIWFESAKNHALYANQSGFYDDVLVYLGLKK
jgi:transitional endoplasmic reticulum ATPase